MFNRYARPLFGHTPTILRPKFLSQIHVARKLFTFSGNAFNFIMISSRSNYSTSSHHPELDTVFSEENKARTIDIIHREPAGWFGLHDALSKRFTRRAAVLIPLCVNVKGEPSFCYTLRSLKLSKHSGEISFPGGLADPEESDPVVTALRETREELEIPETDIEIWTVMRSMRTLSSATGVTPVVGLIKEPLDPDTLQVNPKEVETAFTISFSHLCDEANWGRNQCLGGFSSPIYKNMKVYHPHGEYSEPDLLRSTEKCESTNNSLRKDVRLWGLTAILTHIMLKALLPNVYNRHVRCT